MFPRSSTEDVDDGRSSPEPHPLPVGILKRKSSSAGGSGSHSPESVENNSGSARSSFIASILKKQSSCEDVELSAEDNSRSSSRPTSILKKIRQAAHHSHHNSTDDDLDDLAEERPRSILKSKKSEDSLSPLSDAADLALITAAPAHVNRGEVAKPRPILKQRDSKDDVLLSPTHDE